MVSSKPIMCWVAIFSYSYCRLHAELFIYCLERLWFGWKVIQIKGKTRRYQHNLAPNQLHWLRRCLFFQFNNAIPILSPESEKGDDKGERRWWPTLPSPTAISISSSQCFFFCFLNKCIHPCTHAMLKIRYNSLFFYQKEVRHCPVSFCPKMERRKNTIIVINCLALSQSQIKNLVAVDVDVASSPYLTPLLHYY